MPDMVASLDAALAKYGEDLTLRALGTPNVDCGIRARWKDVDAADLVQGGPVAQNRAKVIMSPSEIAAAMWPSGGGRNPQKGDKVVRLGRAHNVEHVKVFAPGGAVARIELLVAG